MQQHLTIQIMYCWFYYYHYCCPNCDISVDADADADADTDTDTDADADADLAIAWFVLVSHGRVLMSMLTIPILRSMVFLVACFSVLAGGGQQWQWQ